MDYTNGLAREEFLQHMFEEFPSVFDNTFSREMLENIVDYGLSGNLPSSKNSLYYFLSDMIPEIEPQDLLPYMDSNMLTREVLGNAPDYSTANFLADEEKMRDFVELSKDEFLASYSYLTEDEYDNTMALWLKQQTEKASLADQISAAAAKAETQDSLGHQNNKDHSI